MTYPNEAMVAVCELLLDDYELTPEQISNLAKDLPRECASMVENRAEDAWMDQQQSLMESGGLDDSAYRRDMTAAGRGHLLGREA
ncbi:MAG TPA: hypothetical protein PLV87_08020 [Opitutaceae bacterium]|nr:hypothetical protein [Opitutaceae bacterium]